MVNLGHTNVSRIELCYRRP